MTRHQCYPDFENNVMIHVFPVSLDPRVIVHTCECRAWVVKKGQKQNMFSGKKERNE
jgi:hypothetical protein